MTPDEEWRPIAGYEGHYEVSSLGRVRSLTRSVQVGGWTRNAKGRVLAAYHGDNYSKVTLKVGGKGTTRNIHALVAEAFIGPRPEGMDVCHNNGQAHDNRAENLRYDTHANNQRQMVADGSHPNARKTHCKNGHPFDEANTYIQPSTGGRQCRTCTYLHHVRVANEKKACA